MNRMRPGLELRSAHPDPDRREAGVAAVRVPCTSDISANSGELRAARRQLVRGEFSCRIDRKSIISRLCHRCPF